MSYRRFNVSLGPDVFVESAKTPFAKRVAENSLETVEKSILKMSSAKNAQLIKDQIDKSQNLDGSFSQIGMWKVKSKLFPRKCDPQMGKKDEDGNLITSSEALKKLYCQAQLQLEALASALAELSFNFDFTRPHPPTRERTET